VAQEPGLDFWAEFSQLLRIERMDRPDPALLAPSNAVFLRENLKLRLMNARLALLSRDGNTFREDVRISREWLERYFDLSNAAAAAAQGRSRRAAEDSGGRRAAHAAASQTALRACRPSPRRADGAVRRSGAPTAGPRRRQPPGEEELRPAMRGLLWLIGLFALAAGLAVAGRYNEGYALLVWPPYRIQISLNLLILLLVGGFAAAYSLSRLVARTMALPRAVQRFARARAASGPRRPSTTRCACASKGVSARPSSRPLRPMKPTNRPAWRRCWPPGPPIPARRERYRYWLGKAAEHDGECVCAPDDRGQAGRRGRRFDEAAERIAELQAGGQRHIAALRLALRTAQATGNWGEAVRWCASWSRSRRCRPSSPSRSSAAPTRKACASGPAMPWP
jgi:hypothetical protein